MAYKYCKGNCSFCGIYFERAYTRRAHAVCSDACKRHKVNSRRSRWKKPRKKVSIICWQCNEPVMRADYGKKYNRVFCGRDCYQLSVKLKDVDRMREKRLEHALKRLVKSEISALRRIARKQRFLSRYREGLKCGYCAASYVKKKGKSGRRPSGNYCSAGCSQKYLKVVRSLYSKKHREKFKKTDRYKYLKRMDKARRRALKRGGSTAERVDPLQILNAWGWRCYLCGRDTPANLRGTNDPAAPEIDHITPLSKGGSHTADNMACCCRSCNSKKGGNLLT